VDQLDHIADLLRRLRQPANLVICYPCFGYGITRHARYAYRQVQFEAAHAALLPISEALSL